MEEDRTIGIEGEEEVREITRLNLEGLLDSKPETMTNEKFLIQALKDKIQKEVSREYFISIKRTVFDRVNATIKSIRMYPYFGESDLEINVLSENGKLIVAKHPENLDKKLEGNVYKIHYGDEQFGELIIQPHKELGSYEECLLQSIVNTLGIHIKNALDYEKHALEDERTGLYNLRFFNETIKKLFNAAKQKPGDGLSLIYMDLDNLKGINKDHPLHHDAGHILLIGFAKLLQNSITSSRDFVSRIGGDEFALIMPDTKLINAVNMANKIKENAEKQGFYPKKDDPYFGRYRDGFLIDKLYPMIRSTVSIGVTHSDYALEPNELIQNADSAEHEAKKTKNKVICLHNY